MNRTGRGIACGSYNTIWDLGFYDGSDTAKYLLDGYCVIGVEADPTMVEAVSNYLYPFITSGQLQILNVALSPDGDVAERTFYLNRCTKEWNSFLPTVGCRSCDPPYALNMTGACDLAYVRATPCLDLFEMFPAPHYIKLDIEGAESGCFSAMQELLARGQNMGAGGGADALPPFLSTELASISYLDMLHQLGYTKFKLVRQDVYYYGKSTTGPWGHNALDCRFGATWRTYPSIADELQRIQTGMSNGTQHDPCPTG